MSKNITEIPFTELVERVVSLGRANPDAYGKVRGIIQDIYLRELPTKHDWTFLYASSAITTIEQYDTGNVSINTDDRIAHFSTDVTLTADMAGRKIKFSGNPVVYEITSFITARSAQILPPLQADANLSNVSYKIFQDTYALAPDFDRFPKDGGIYKWQGGRKEILPEEPYQEYAENYSGEPSLPQKIRLVGTDTAGNQLVEFRPPPKENRAYSYDYLHRLYPMQETTTNLIRGASAGGTTVDLIGTTQFTEISTSERINYIRVDIFGTGADSVWYPIISYSGNSSLTLRTSFGGSGVTSSANYVISEAPKIPTLLHPAIMYGALAHLLADQGDENAELYLQRATQVIQEARRLYVSRVYSQDIHGIHEEWDYRR